MDGGGESGIGIWRGAWMDGGRDRVVDRMDRGREGKREGGMDRFRIKLRIDRQREGWMLDGIDLGRESWRGIWDGWRRTGWWMDLMHAGVYWSCSGNVCCIWRNTVLIMSRAKE